MDIPREESVLSVAFFDQFGTKCWSLMRRLIQQKIYMKKPLSSIVTLTLLLTKPGGTVMDKASVLEVFKYRSP